MMLTILALLITALLMGCSSTAPATPTLVKSAPLPIPPQIQRLAVVHPAPTTQQQENAYRRLDAAVFQVKAARPELRLLDRIDLDLVLDSQHHDLRLMTNDERAVHVGRLVGADSILLFRIDPASPPDQAGVTVTAKLVTLESGEILFHHVITARHPWPLHTPLTAHAAKRTLQETLDAAVDAMIADVHQAFGLVPEDPKTLTRLVVP